MTILIDSEFQPDDVTMPNDRTLSCPDATTLQRFLDEALGEREEVGLQEHLDACEACRRALERVAGEPELWLELREHLHAAPEPVALPERADPDPEAALTELRGLLDPTDDPHRLGRLGGYEVCGLVGRGATGLVLKAFEARLDRYVAIKLMSPVYRANGAARRRFEREGRAIAAVSHEHVVPIYAVDDHRGLPYIVMKYVPGLSLEQRIERDGPLDTRAVARGGLQVARGLAAAHAQGIVHRDVKPANVILEATVERAMVTDFGLARVADEASMTRSGTITGTPQYMSPEQARGASIDPRSDLFSLGSTLYAACTGRAPFRAETVYGVLNRVCESEPRPVREINPEVEGWLAEFVAKLMSKEPADRFASATEVADALAAELAHLQNPTVAGEPPRAWRRSPSAPSPAPGGRRRGLRALALTAGVVGAVALGVSRLGGGTDGEVARGSLFPPGGGTSRSLAVPQDRRALESAPGEPARVRWTAGPDETFEQDWAGTFAVGEAETLSIRVDRGDIEVVPGPEGAVRVDVLRRVSATSEAAAAARLASHEVLFGAEGDALTLLLPDPDGASTHAQVRVSIPPGLELDVETHAGSLAIGAIDGDVRALATGGDIRLGRLGGRLWVRTNQGSIDASAGVVGEAQLFAAGGDVVLAGAQSTAFARTSGGSIYLLGSPGAVSAQTSGGDVVVSDLAGPTSAHASVGDVRLRLSRTPERGANFTATSGDVRVELAEGIAATIAARGDLSTELPVAVEPAPPGGGVGWSVSAVNGGGARIEVMSSTGTVSIGTVPVAAIVEDGVAEFRVVEEGSGEPETLGGSGLGGSGLGGSGLGGSGLGGSGLGGSGLGGSGAGRPRGEWTERARQRTSGAPRPGALVSVPLDDPGWAMDGFVLYLPVSHDEREEPFPVLVYLQGAYGVGDDIDEIQHWGLARLLRDEHDLSTERNRLLLDEFIVVAPHIQGGSYDDEPEVVERILEEVHGAYKTDRDRVYLTGLSRGAHGTWGLAARLPDTFAAIAPVGGGAGAIEDFAPFAAMPIWIAHNHDDGVVPFSRAVAAMRAVEAAGGEAFLRTDARSIGATPYREHAHVLTAAAVGGHDAWTDLYTSVEFYRWLLEQRRERPARAPGGEVR